MRWMHDLSSQKRSAERLKSEVGNGVLKNGVLVLKINVLGD